MTHLVANQIIETSYSKKSSSPNSLFTVTAKSVVSVNSKGDKSKSFATYMTIIQMEDNSYQVSLNCRLYKALKRNQFAIATAFIDREFFQSIRVAQKIAEIMPTIEKSAINRTYNIDKNIELTLNNQSYL